MEENQNSEVGCGCSTKKDRYSTFDGIDCDHNARRVMACIERNMRGQRKGLPFLVR